MAAMEPVYVECPECRMVIPIPLRARLEDSPENMPHSVLMVIDPDVSEVWLHAWTEHGVPEKRGKREDRG